MCDICGGFRPYWGFHNHIKKVENDNLQLILEYLKLDKVMCEGCKNVNPEKDNIYNVSRGYEYPPDSKIKHKRKKGSLCRYFGCETRGIFNSIKNIIIKPDGTKIKPKGRYCLCHAEMLFDENDIIDCGHKSAACISDNCYRRAFYYRHDDKKKKVVYCRTCAYMINEQIPNQYIKFIDPTKCCKHIEDGQQCKIRSSFNYPNETSLLYCEKHALVGMCCREKVECNYIDDKDKKCSITAGYNFEEYGRPARCSHHKTEGMIEIYRNTCRFEGCKITASFNYDYCTKGLYCGKHKDDDMVDMSNVKCVEVGCGKQAGFGKIDENGKKIKTHCSLHKMDDMINLRPKIVNVCELCGENAHYKKAGDTIWYCAECKTVEMSYNGRQLCSVFECYKVPQYAIPNDHSKLFCSDHSNNLMDNIAQKNKICKEDGCKTQSTYGYPSQGFTRCREHRKEGMTKNPNKRCIEPTCGDYAIYGVETNIHCYLHASDNEKLMIVTKCKECKDIGIISNDELCNKCDRDKKRLLKKGQREMRIIKLLEENNIKYIHHDKIIDNGECTLYRPDILIMDKNLQFALIVEIDEDQHESYKEQCEYRRTHGIAQSLGGIATIFIRYNPDKYKSKNGKNLCTEEREKTLLRWIRYINHERFNPKDITEYLREIKLFYDWYDEEKVEMIIYDVFDDKKFTQYSQSEDKIETIIVK